MTKSMTGYGSADGSIGKIKLTAEVRSVNNRFLDCTVRMPRSYNFAEDALKAEVQKAVSRGKVDVYISADTSAADDVKISLNEPLLDAYMSALGAISAKYGLPNNTDAMSAARLPDVLITEKTEIDAGEFTAALRSLLASALKEFDAMRQREGARLEADIAARLTEIERLTAIVEERSPKCVAEYRERLRQRMEEVLASANIDQSRILTEAAIFADKTAVDEETVRLRSHISQLRAMLSASAPMGRKMDFLVQEFNREANTIGSKCNDTELSHVVVDLKAEIEKIREQAQNIE